MKNIHKIDLDLSCDTCDTKFNTSFCLEKHYENDHESKQFLCVLCKENFKLSHHLKRHLISEHSQQCEFCKETFDCEKSCEKHKQIHLKLEFTCSVCEKQFDQEKKLKTHFALAHEPKFKYNCEKCQIEEFHSPQEMNSHFVEFHKEDENFKCEHCDLKFFITELLDWHLLLVHKIKQHTCRICLKGIKKRADLKRHIEHIHEGKDNVQKVLLNFGQNAVKIRSK